MSGTVPRKQQQRAQDPGAELPSQQSGQIIMTDEKFFKFKALPIQQLLLSGYFVYTNNPGAWQTIRTEAKDSLPGA